MIDAWVLGRELAVLTTGGLTLVPVDRWRDPTIDTLDIETTLRAPGFTSGGQAIVAGDFDPVTQLAVVATQSGDILVLGQGVEPRILARYASVGEIVTISPSGDWVALGTATGRIAVWRTADMSLLYTFRRHSGRVRALVFSPDETALLSGAVDGKALVSRLDMDGLARDAARWIKGLETIREPSRR